MDLAIERPNFFGGFPCKKTGYFDVQQDRIDEMRGKHGRELERPKARCVFFLELVQNAYGTCVKKTQKRSTEPRLGQD